MSINTNAAKLRKDGYKPIVLFGENETTGDIGVVKISDDGKLKVSGHNKGYYTTPANLRAAHPTGVDGDFAIVGSTDTVWVWDSDTTDWKDSGTGGAVTSVFSRTGAVTAQANDYTWAQIDKTTSDIADITTKSHTSLTDKGTKTHAQIDTHITGDGTDHSQVATNKTHVDGDGSDHADVATNTTHSTGDGSDHADVATNNAKVGVTTQISNIVEDTTPQLGGDLDTNDKNIHVKLPDADGEYSALCMTTQTVDTNSVGVFSLLEMAADGNYDEADADAEATCDGNLVLALESGTGSKKVMHIGFAQEDDWNWTPGKPLYVSTTGGTMTQTAPTDTGDIVRCVGTAMTADMIYFNPSNDYVEISE
jgi:hypothetical protein